MRSWSDRFVERRAEMPEPRKGTQEDDDLRAACLMVHRLFGRQEASCDLPQIFAPPEDENAERAPPRAELSQSSSLCAAAVVHRKIHMVEMEHKAKVNERLGMVF
eukprot:Skav229744  [mRNA]  locus=scaffold1287:365545:366852:+ [translate_table: standard]